MTRRLLNNQTRCISNAIDYYEDEYTENFTKYSWREKQEYIYDRLIDEEGVDCVSKKRKKPGRPPNWWYYSMEPKDIHSLLFNSIQDKTAFILKWG